MQTLNKLVAQREEESVSGLTFTVADLQMGDRSKSGNYGFRATCANGKKISFWASNMESIVEETSEGNFKVLPGVRFPENPDKDGFYGLIPENAEQGGYWK
jgi:hypothetical protein